MYTKGYNEKSEFQLGRWLSPLSVSEDLRHLPGNCFIQCARLILRGATSEFLYSNRIPLSAWSTGLPSRSLGNEKSEIVFLVHILLKRGWV